MPSKEMHTAISEEIKITCSVVDFSFFLTYMVSSDVGDVYFWGSSVPGFVVVYGRVLTRETKSVPLGHHPNQYWSQWLYSLAGTTKKITYIE